MQEATNLENDLAKYLNQWKTHRKYRINSGIKQILPTKNKFLTLYAHTWAKYETVGSSEICSDEDAIIGVKR